MCSGSIRGDDMEKAFINVLKRLNITFEHDYYDPESSLAGSVYRTNYVMNGQNVAISLASTNANQYRENMNNEPTK